MSLMISSQIFIKEKDDLVEFNTIIIIFISLILGSFLNMLIYRLPLQINLLNPKRSICPSCKTIIKWYENIPLFSYIFLQAKCSNCKVKIPFSYFLVELLTPIITILLYNKLGLTTEFYIICFIFYLLILLSFIDLQYKAVPDYLLILLLTITLLYLGLYKIENYSYFFIFAGAIVIIEMFVTYYIQNIKSSLLKDESLRNQKALGDGDIPIFAIIGGVLGFNLGISAILLSAIFAIIPSIINIILKKDIETPFIPYLTLGFFITYIFKIDIVKNLAGIMVI